MRGKDCAGIHRWQAMLAMARTLSKSAGMPRRRCGGVVARRQKEERKKKKGNRPDHLAGTLQDGQGWGCPRKCSAVRRIGFDGKKPLPVTVAIRQASTIYGPPGSSTARILARGKPGTVLSEAIPSKTGGPGRGACPAKTRRAGFGPAGARAFVIRNWPTRKIIPRSQLRPLPWRHVPGGNPHGADDLSYKRLEGPGGDAAGVFTRP